MPKRWPKLIAGLLLCFAAGGFSRAQTIDLAAQKIIDLSHVFNADTIVWPTEKSGFTLKQSHKGPTQSGFFYYSNTFCSPEHGGTHIDAPMHFAERRWTNSEIPLDRLIGPAVVIDVSDKARADPDYRLTPDDILAFERVHGLIPPHAIVLLRTGWSARWPDRKAYLGDDAPGDVSNLHFPSFGPEAASLLVDARQTRLIGVDTASVDYGPSRDFLVHRIIGAANVAGLENLTNLEQLPATGAVVVALPMKIGLGSGAPTRVIAFTPK